MPNNFLTNLTLDLKDIFSGKAFQIEYGNPDIPFSAKIVDGEPVMCMVVGPRYIKIGVMRRGKDGRYMIEDTVRLQDQNATGTLADMFRWGFTHSETEQRLKTHKIQKFVVGFINDSVDSIVLPYREIPELMGLQLTDPTAQSRISKFVSGGLSKFMEGNASMGKFDVDAQYGILLMPGFDTVLLIPEKKTYISDIITLIHEHGGTLLRLISYPTSLLSACVEDGIVREKPLGLALLVANKSITMVGWRHESETTETVGADGKPVVSNAPFKVHIFLRTRKIVDPGTGVGQRQFKESPLGKMITDCFSEWTKRNRSGIRNAGGVNMEKFCAYHHEIIEKDEPKALENTMKEIYKEKGFAIEAATLKRVRAELLNDEEDHMEGELVYTLL